MTNEEKQGVKDFLDGLPTGVTLVLGCYDPNCLDLDLGYVEDRFGVYIQAVLVVREMNGQYQWVDAQYHCGTTVVPCVNPYAMMQSIEGYCSTRSWIERVVVPGRRLPGAKGF